MRLRALPLLLLSLGVLSACREAKVTSYRIPKEKPEELPGMSAAAASSSSAGNSTNLNMANTAVPTAEGDGLAWTAPSDWTAKPASAMRKGSYTVRDGKGAEADLSITAFPGDVGGELANLNRWRGQIQLPPLAEADLAGAVSRVSQNGLNFTIVDFANDKASSGQRVLGAIVPFQDSTWFFKLMGPGAVVEQAKPAFLDFLKTVHAATASPKP